MHLPKWMGIAFRLSLVCWWSAPSVLVNGPVGFNSCVARVVAVGPSYSVFALCVAGVVTRARLVELCEGLSGCLSVKERPVQFSQSVSSSSCAP